jgi:hypothetical protein
VPRVSPSSVVMCPRAGVVCCGRPLLFLQFGLGVFNGFAAPEGIRVYSLPQVYAMLSAFFNSICFGPATLNLRCCFVVGCCFHAFRPACCDADCAVFLWFFQCSRVGKWVLVGRVHVSRWGVVICCEWRILARLGE